MSASLTRITSLACRLATILAALAALIAAAATNAMARPGPEGGAKTILAIDNADNKTILGFYSLA